MKRHLWLSLAIALAGFLLAVAISRWGGMLTLAAQVNVAEWLFVRDGGPRLGARPIDARIVLVDFDYKTAEELGYVRSYVEDVKVYRNLMDAGAEVVCDTRMVAAADEAGMAELRDLLDGMREINNDGRLVRDIWLSVAEREKADGRYANLISQNPINTHPHALPSVESRLYPLVYFSVDGPEEAAPLAIVRRVKKLPRATAAEVGEELRHSGVMSEWHKHSPQQIPKTDVPASPYRLGDLEINWLPFASTSTWIPPVAFWVSYDPPAAEYKRYSYVDVFKQADSADFHGKIVLIGYDPVIDPSADAFEIPSRNGKASGADVLASATQTLLDERTMVALPVGWSAAVAAVLMLAVALAAGLMKPLAGAATSAALLLGYFAFTVVVYRNGWYPDCFVTPLSGMLTAVAAGTANAWQDARLRRHVLDLFGRYVPRAVVNQLMLRPELESLTLGGEVRDVTVMFADIRGFTTFAQDLPPAEVVRQLNALLEIMVACTFENEGTLDKFIGDAILVLFNAPLDQADHTERAVRTAVTIQQRLAGHGSGLRVGVGVHRGQAVVGNIGTPQRMEYTAIGSTVNIASRLCDHAQPGDVVISRSVLDALDGKFTTESLGVIQVKGVTGGLQAARVVNCKEAIGA